MTSRSRPRWREFIDPRAVCPGRYHATEGYVFRTLTIAASMAMNQPRDRRRDRYQRRGINDAMTRPEPFMARW